MNIDLLKRLCETPGIPGREERVRDLIKKEVRDLFDEITVDPMGSLICRRGPRGKGARGKKGGRNPRRDARHSNGRSNGHAGPARVMILCHMDEIGFYVSHVDSKGWIWVNPAGGFDARNLFSRRVLVCTSKGDHKGVMNPGGRPIHISSQEERTKVPEVKQFFVDIGHAPEKVKQMVQVGDFVVMDEPCLAEMGNKVVSKALDNRVACWLGIESIRRLDKSGQGHACEIYTVFTTQEEVGLRGARTAAYAIKPDIGLGLDVTLSCDTPGVPEEESVTQQGKGFGLHLKDSSFISDKGLVDDIEAIAKKNKIPFQRTILAAGGQDGAAAQQAAAGARAVGIVVGTRYIHTVTEMIDKTDLAAARDVIAAYLTTVK